MIKGVVRKTICWPNRNGFYYVLDRITGEFLTGVPFVDVNWATGLTTTGRPILADGVKVSKEGRRISPGLDGGTNWQNPAFDPTQKSIFIPAHESSSIFTKVRSDTITRGRNGLYAGSGWRRIGSESHKVLALDAATGMRKWEYLAPPGTTSGNSNTGLLSTEGGLVFGASGGIFFALDTDTGQELWRRQLGGITRSAPISFTVDGRQVVLITAGRALFEFGL
jgi:alcohol dehydrogenase (cytochrome c)